MHCLRVHTERISLARRVESTAITEGESPVDVLSCLRMLYKFVNEWLCMSSSPNRIKKRRKVLAFTVFSSNKVRAAVACP